MTNFALDGRAATDHFPGIGRYISNLAHAMVPQLREGERLTILHDPSQPSRWQLPQPGGGVALLETNASPFRLSQQWRIPRLLRQLEADMYHSPYYLMPYRPGVPTLLTFYDLIPQRYPAMVSWQSRWFTHFATKLALRSADKVACISKATRTDFLDTYRFPAEQAFAIPLAPDARFTPQGGDTAASIRVKYGLPDSYVLYLGINKPHKNLARLITGWNQLSESLSELPTLIIAGAWDERYPETKRLVDALGLSDSVRFLGPVADQDLPSLYSGAELFVFPSLYEGFGLPVVEAMACGTPVACANASSLPEVAGDAAAYFDPEDADDLASTLRSVLADAGLRQGMAERGLVQAAKFSWESTAAQTLRLYRSLVR